MIFSLNKEIQAPSILSIITYFSRQPLVNSTPYYPFITYSLAKIRKKHNSLSLVAKRSKNHHRTRTIFWCSPNPIKNFPPPAKKKEKTSPRTLDYPCCIRGICRFSLNRLQRYPRNEKKKKKKDVSSPLTVKDQSFTSLEHGPPFSPPRCERPRVRSSSKLIRPPSPLCSLL